MGELQNALDKEIDKLPRTAARQLARGKLAALGIHSVDIVDRLADAILTGANGLIDETWPEDVVIRFDDSDIEGLQAAMDNLVENLPEIVETLSKETAERITAGLRKQWDESRPVEEPTKQTRSRVLKDWGKAIDALRMLVSLCAQEGDEFNIRHLKSKRRALRDEAFARFHIRACRIADEILTLLEHGYAEGAQARWRTLHEVAVTTTLIREGGDALAARFFDHDAVERKRLLDDARRAAKAAGEPGPRIADAKEIERDFARAIVKYDKHFQGMYGWASGQLGMPKEPKFHDLQETVGSLSLKHRFRVASSGNHASVATLGQPVHRWDPTTTIPGTFAAGFEGPGVDTAQAIIQVTTALYDDPWDLDRLVFVRTLGQLRDETAEIWLRTARRIDEREQRAIDRAARFGRGRRLGYVKAKPVIR